MRRFWFTTGLVIAVAALMPGVAVGQPVPAKMDDEPLPEGAIRRLGTARYRLGVRWSHVTLLPDQKEALIHCDSGYARMDLATGTILGLYQTGLERRVRHDKLIRGDTVIACNDEGIRVFELKTGKLLRQWKGLPFEPDRPGYASTIGEWSASDDGRTVAFVWDEFNLVPKRLSTLWVVRFQDVQAEASEYEIPYARNAWVTVAPDGKTLAYSHIITVAEPTNKGVPGVYRSTVKLCSTATGKEIHDLDTSAEFRAGTQAKFSPDGKRLFTPDCLKDGCSEVWDVATGKRLVTFAPLPKPELHIYDQWASWQMSEDGSKIARVRTSGLVFVWDANDGSFLSAFEAPKYTHRPEVGFSPYLNTQLFGSDVQFLHDGKLLAFGSLGSGLQMWIPETGRMLTPMSDMASSVWAIGFTDGGKSLLAGGDNLPLYQWNLETRDPPQRIDFNLTDEHDWGRWIDAQFMNRQFSHDGRTMSVMIEKELYVFSTSGGLERFKIGMDDPDVHDPRRGVFSHDGKLLACCGVYYSATNRKEATTFTLFDSETGKRSPCGQVVFGYVGCGFTPDNKRLILSSRRPGRVVSIEPFRPELQYSSWNLIQRRTVSSATIFFPHDTYGFAIGADNRTVIFPRQFDNSYDLICWDSETGQELPIRSSLQAFLFTTPPVMSPDGKLVAIGSTDSRAFHEGNIHLLAWPSLKQLAKLRVHKGRIHALVFSPDGTLLASGGDDTGVLLWDMTRFHKQLQP